MLSSEGASGGVDSDSCTYTWLNGYHAEVMYFAFIVASCSATPKAFPKVLSRQVSPLSLEALI